MDYEKIIVKVPNVLIFRLERFTFFPQPRKSRDIINYAEDVDVFTLLPKEYEDDK